MVIQIAFLILHKISPLENALTEIMTLRKLVYIQRPLINIHCNIKDRQILCELEYGCPFSIFVSLPSWIRIPDQDPDPLTQLNQDPKHWFLCGNEVYTDSFFHKIVLKVLPSKHFTIL